MKKMLITTLFLLFSITCFAANIEISPVKVYLDGKTRIEKVSIKNRDESDISLKVKVFRWTQEEGGADKYEDTEDLIVVPRIINLKKGEERILRIGINKLLGTKEATYRIYIEEVPQREEETKGATVKLYMKIGIPVFVTPEKTHPKVEIEEPKVENKELKFKVINKGNAHTVIGGITVTGNDAHGKNVFIREVGGWYLLAEAARHYQVPIPEISGAQNLKIKVKLIGPPDKTLEREISLQKPQMRGDKND